MREAPSVLFEIGWGFCGVSAWLSGILTWKCCCCSNGASIFVFSSNLFLSLVITQKKKKEKEKERNEIKESSCDCWEGSVNAFVSRGDWSERGKKRGRDAWNHAKKKKGVSPPVTFLLIESKREKGERKKKKKEIQTLVSGPSWLSLYFFFLEGGYQSFDVNDNQEENVASPQGVFLSSLCKVLFTHF